MGGNKILVVATALGWETCALLPTTTARMQQERPCQERSRRRATQVGTRWMHGGVPAAAAAIVVNF